MSEEPVDVVVDDPENSRYILKRGDRVLGETVYELAERSIRFVHTGVPDIGEKGLGSKLVAGALDDVRADGSRKVIAICPFVRGFIARHEEYQDLLLRPLPPGAGQG